MMQQFPMVNTNALNDQSTKITFQINNTLANPMFDVLEKTEMIGGFEWSVRLENVELYGLGHLKFDIYIGCNENCQNKLWLANASIAIHRGWAAEPFHSFTNNFFNGAENVRMQDYNIHSHSQALTIDITVLRSLPSLLDFDTNLEMTFVNSQEGHGRVETNLIAVNKYSLASFSNYFRNLFFGNWAENHQQQHGDIFLIKEEPNFDMTAFSKMIYASMAMGWMMDEMFFSTLLGPNVTANDQMLQYQMAIKILKLSVKYDVPMMQNCCENYFISQLEQQNFPKMELLEEAQHLGLQNLEERTLASINALDFSRDIRNNLQIHSRLGKRTQDEVFEQIEKSVKRTGCFNYNEVNGPLGDPTQHPQVFRMSVPQPQPSFVQRYMPPGLSSSNQQMRPIMMMNGGPPANMPSSSSSIQQFQFRQMAGMQMQMPAQQQQPSINVPQASMPPGPSSSNNANRSGRNSKK